MRVITDRNECNQLYVNFRKSILDSYGYKKILNSHYDPELFLFFVQNEDVVPLVVKNNLVTFYGGTRHNHITSMPHNKTLLNDMLSYLVEKSYIFQFTSMNVDCFSLLNASARHFDVPFPPEWHYQQIQRFDKMNILESVTGRKRWEFKRILRKSQDYTFTTLSFSQFEEKYNMIIKKHTDYFSARQKQSVWQGNEALLLEILRYFEENENLLIRIIEFNREIVAIYTLVYNDEEMIYYFGTSLNKDDPYISKIMYFDMLDTARVKSAQTNIQYLNALRGAYANKKRFGLAPIGLYALVNDDKWTVQDDMDIDPRYFDDIYGRNSWGRSPSYE